MIQVISAVSIIVLVLLQHGKGADMGAAFGSGASGSLFGASGAANFLSRTTGVMAAVFFVATLALVYASTSQRTAHTGAGGLMSTEPATPDGAATKAPSSEVPTGAPAGAPAGVPTGGAPTTAAPPAAVDARPELKPDSKADQAPPPARTSEVPK